jgi:ABC-2 type transport system ATP-binding protein
MASVLLHNPKVIFLDEPLVGLDPKAGRLVKRIFQELSQRKVTIFMSTHTLEIAEKLCHRIGIIQEGRLVALGTNEDCSLMSNEASGSQKSISVYGGGGKNKEWFPVWDWPSLSLGAI